MATLAALGHRGLRADTSRAMRDEESAAEQRRRDEEEQLSRRGMLLLTAGLTDEGDTFLLGALAVLLMGGL